MDTFWINTNLICDIRTEFPENMFHFSAHFCSQPDNQAVPLLRPSFVSPSSRRPGFNTWPVVVGFVMGQVEMGQFCLFVRRFCHLCESHRCSLFNHFSISDATRCHCFKSVCK